MGEQVLSDECLENRFNRQVGRAAARGILSKRNDPVNTDIGEF